MNAKRERANGRAPLKHVAFFFEFPRFVVSNNVCAVHKNQLLWLIP